MKSQSLVDSIVKGLLFVIFAPMLICLALQSFAVAIAMLAPLLLVLALIIGVSSGISAALTLGLRRSRRDHERPLLPPGPPLLDYRSRRPRGGQYLP